MLMPALGTQDAAKHSGKSHKKTVPPSFVEVIDCLVDFVLLPPNYATDNGGESIAMLLGYCMHLKTAV